MNQPLIGAVEAGGTKFVLALARADGTILERSRIATRTPGECFPEMTAFFAAAAARHGPIAAFGIASFGPLDIDLASPSYGAITTTTKPGWSGASFPAALAQFAAPIVVDTDVNGAAMGEWAGGAAQNPDGTRCTTAAYTTVGTGIGTGVVRADTTGVGRPVMGFSHFESGHIPVPHDRLADPFPGVCPFHGDCLEGLASGPAVEQRWGMSLDRMADPAPAVALLAGYISQLAVSLVMLHMPDRLIFGGGVMKAPGLIEAVRAQTEAKLGGYLKAPQLDPGLTRYIVLPGLGDDAGIAGAIALGRSALA